VRSPCEVRSATRLRGRLAGSLRWRASWAELLSGGRVSSACHATRATMALVTPRSVHRPRTAPTSQVRFVDTVAPIMGASYLYPCSNARMRAAWLALAGCRMSHGPDELSAEVSGDVVPPHPWPHPWSMRAHANPCRRGARMASRRRRCDGAVGARRTTPSRLASVGWVVCIFVVWHDAVSVHGCTPATDTQSHRRRVPTCVAWPGVCAVYRDRDAREWRDARRAGCV